MAKKQVKKAVTKTMKDECCTKMSCPKEHCGYFLGFIGAAVYYIAAATSFWGGVLGLLKAIVWPVFLVMALFKYLGA